MNRGQKKLVAFLTILYGISYIIRINMSVIVAEITRDTGLTKSAMSVALTGAFITYALGQLVSGYLGDRMQPRRLMLAGIFVSSLINLSVPYLVASPFLLAAVWSVNGLAQAMVWPPIVRLLTNYLDDEAYGRSIVWISLGGSTGTILLYLLSPIIITLLGWNFVFYISAGLGLLLSLFIPKLCPDVKNADTAARRADNKAPRQSVAAVFLAPAMLMILVAVMIHGALRDSVMTWMPSYINETYDLGSAISILTGVLLPMLTIGVNFATGALYLRVIKNPMLCAAVVFAVGGAAASALVFAGGRTAVLSITALALLSSSMHGVNFLLVCILPGLFKNSGSVSLISGIINTCTYVGSAVSTFGISLLTENSGWGATSAVWCVIAWAGTVLCLLAALWHKRKKESALFAG